MIGLWRKNEIWAFRSAYQALLCRCMGILCWEAFLSASFDLILLVASLSCLWKMPFPASTFPWLGCISPLSELIFQFPSSSGHSWQNPFEGWARSATVGSFSASVGPLWSTSDSSPRFLEFFDFTHGTSLFFFVFPVVVINMKYEYEQITSFTICSVWI